MRRPLNGYKFGKRSLPDTKKHDIEIHGTSLEHPKDVQCPLLPGLN